MDGYGIKYGDQVQNFRIFPGDVLKIQGKDEDGRRTDLKRVKVAAVYRHHVLLDMGTHKESRRKADIVLGLCDVVGRR